MTFKYTVCQNGTTILKEVTFYKQWEKDVTTLDV